MMWLIIAAVWLVGACSFFCIGAISKRGDQLAENMMHVKKTQRPTG